MKDAFSGLLPIAFNKVVLKVDVEKFSNSPYFSEPANQHVAVQSAVEEIRDVVKKQERELDDMRARMRDSVSEERQIALGLYPKTSAQIMAFGPPTPLSEFKKEQKY